MDENIPKEVTIKARCENLVDIKQMKGAGSILEEKPIYTKTPTSRNMGEGVKGHYRHTRKVEGKSGTR